MPAHPYRGQGVVLTSMHGKERALQGAFATTLGLRLVAARLDTDRLGTFTGEVERPAPPRETALLKARWGIRETGIARGVASEGAYGPHPDSPFLPFGVEILAFVDDELGIEVTETRRTRQAFLEHTTVTAPGAELDRFLGRVGFGLQAVIVRPDDVYDGALVVKGLRARSALHRAVARCIRASPTGLARVETDMRAHQNRNRMGEIAALAQLLAGRLATLCPGCAAPGFGLVGALAGLPCTACGTPTAHAHSTERACSRCGHRIVQRTEAPGAPPADCPACNP